MKRSTRIDRGHTARKRKLRSRNDAGVISGKADFSPPLVGKVGAELSHSSSRSQSTFDEMVQMIGVTDYPRVRVKLEPHGHLEPSVPFVEAMLGVFEFWNGVPVEQNRAKLQKDGRGAVKDACEFMAAEASGICAYLSPTWEGSLPKSWEGPLPNGIGKVEMFREATLAFRKVLKRFGLKYDSEFHLGGKILTEAWLSKTELMKNESIKNEFKADVAGLVNVGLKASDTSNKKEEKKSELNIRFTGTVGGDALQSHDIPKWKESLKMPLNWRVTLRKKQKFVWKVLHPEIGILCKHLLKFSTVFAMKENLDAILNYPPTAPESSAIPLDELMRGYRLYQSYSTSTLHLLSEETDERLKKVWRRFHRYVSRKWWQNIWILEIKFMDDDHKTSVRLIDQKKLPRDLAATAKLWNVNLTEDDKASMESLWSRFMVANRIRLLIRSTPASEKDNAPAAKSGDPHAPGSGATEAEYGDTRGTAADVPEDVTASDAPLVVSSSTPTPATASEREVLEEEIDLCHHRLEEPPFNSRRVTSPGSPSTMIPSNQLPSPQKTSAT